MPSGNPDTKGQPSLVEAALFGLCPRCGARTLFDGIARFAPCCRACALDYSAFNVGDGPAAFLTLIVGGLIAVLAIWLQLAVEPPFWLHIVLWVPLATLLVIGGLRAAKAALLHAEYTRDAREAGSGDL
ncbi:MAG: DUF983 domain-containing protein [Sphingomonadaceae bacterium]|nr:DUF983 domain-containing protein [Novosphingobium sp.]MCB2087572.1 DUF983 domain-containing protein [Sphingomonadaceae bacterium]MCP5378940.1 DUF983 domain-containing protein [Novosphingobium sp.]